MCTSITLHTKDHYFGRNLDLDFSYGEKICFVPRNYTFRYRKMGNQNHHYAILGMAVVMNASPLFFDAVNEKGLAMAGLNFPGNAVYPEVKKGKDNVTPFEFIPWVLGQCVCMKQVRKLLERINLVNIPFSDQVPLSPLHWMISDVNETIVVESTTDGFHIYDNPYHVMTNNPPFPYQQFNLSNYRHLNQKTPENTFTRQTLDTYCVGLGGLGLPGDSSSMSRFVKAVFLRENSQCAQDENSSVQQFFHILGNVEMVKGMCLVENGNPDYTVYTSCMNMEKGRYYYTTYNNRQIHCVDMHKENLDGQVFTCYELVKQSRMIVQNRS